MDLNKIKSAIEERKKEKFGNGQVMNEGLGGGHTTIPTTDSILHELQMAHKTGKSTPTIEKMKAVDKRVDEKKGITTQTSGGGSLSENLSKYTQEPVANPKPNNVEYNNTQMMNERDSLFEKKMNESLSQNLSQYSNQNHNHMNNHMYNQQHQVQSPPMINEQQIVGYVNKILNENIGDVVKNVMKSTIIEMYEADKIKTAMLENRDIIEKVVRDTILQLSQKNKKKTNA